MPRSPGAKRRSPARTPKRKSPKRSPARKSPKRSPTRKSPKRSPRTTDKELYKTYRAYRQAAVVAQEKWVKEHGGRWNSNAFMASLPQGYHELHRKLFKEDLKFTDIMYMSHSVNGVYMRPVKSRSTRKSGSSPRTPKSVRKCAC